MREQAEDGRVQATYDPAFFEQLYLVEDRHFWFRARNEIIGTLARQITTSLAPGYRVLEVGCGTGNVLRILERTCDRGVVIGLDQSAEGLAIARRRTSAVLVRGDARSMTFEEPFDVVGLFDVLEHLPEDMKVLCELRRLARPGGSLLITVPAHPSLWSYFDDASHHCRRYTSRELRGKLEAAGFDVVYLSHYMTTLFPLLWSGRRFAALRARLRTNVNAESRDYDLAVQELRVVPVINELLAGILRWEHHIVARRLVLPFGASLIAVARNPLQDTSDVSALSMYAARSAGSEKT